MSLFIRASRALYPEQLLRTEKGLTTVRPSESMMRATWLRLAMSIPTMNITNTILPKLQTVLPLL